MNPSLEGKVCLLTGGTKGIGKATVEVLAAAKARVFTCSRNQSDLDAVLKEWKEKGYDVQGCVCDVSKADDLKAMVQKVSECYGNRLHALVNNAGMAIRNRALDYQDGDYETIMSNNLQSSYQLTLLCHPMLKAANSSSVVFIGSIAGGPRVVQSGCIYAMAKASLSQLTKSLACEWAADGIRVNCVAPGYIQTVWFQLFLDNEELMKELTSETPMRRCGQPEEIASVIVFFCGNGASFITGQTLYVDGGFTVRGLGY